MSKSFLEKMGLVTDDHPDAAPSASTSTPAPAPAAPPPQMPIYAQWSPQGQAAAPIAPPAPVFAPSAPADPAIVEKIKASVLGTSPILTQFMQNVDLVRAQFPNDEAACMKAALAFTRVNKDALIGELNRTVAAALLHTKSSLESEHKRARDAAVGGLESQLSTISNDISTTQSKILELQQGIATKQANAAQLQGQIHDAEQQLAQQDAVVKGSLAQVEQFVSILSQTVSRL